MSKASEKPLFSGHELKTLGKPEAVCERIRTMAHRVGAGARLPGAAQFCHELGISPNTLSKALGVLESEGVVERRNGVGVFAGRGVVARQLEVALVCRMSFLRAPGHPPVWDALVELLSARALTMEFGFDCSFAQDAQSELDGAQLLSASLREAVESGRMDGVLGVGLPESAAHWIVEQNIPVVNLFGFGHVVVKIDTAQQIKLCVEALAARGCGRIGLWLLAQRSGVMKGDRLLQEEVHKSFGEVLRERGLKIHDELIQSSNHLFELPKSMPSPAEQGFELAKRIFSEPREGWPDGLVILNDNMAHGALVALRQMGLEPGRDVQIAAGANAGSPLRLDANNIILAEVSVPEIVDTMFDRLQRLLKAIPAEQEVVAIPARLRETN